MKCSCPMATDTIKLFITNNSWKDDCHKKGTQRLLYIGQEPQNEIGWEPLIYCWLSDLT